METSIAELKDLIRELVIAQKVTDDKFKETDARFKETDARFKETDKRIKAAFELFEGQWGKRIESLVEGGLIRLLNDRGIKVNRTSMRVKGNHQGENFEFDIIAYNGNEIVIVEVKTSLRVSYVKKFIAKLKKVKIWLPEYKNHTIYGAMAFLQAQEHSDIYAENDKLFVIKATGDSASIVNAPDFMPGVFYTIKKLDCENFVF